MYKQPGNWLKMLVPVEVDHRQWLNLIPTITTIMFSFSGLLQNKYHENLFRIKQVTVDLAVKFASLIC